MSYSFFKTKIDALGVITNGREVVISQATTGSAGLAGVFQAVLGVDAIVLKAHYYDDQTDSIRLTGYVDLLNRENWEFDLRVHDLEDEFSFVMSLLIPGGWNWTDSFLEIPLSVDASEREGESQPITLMDSFGLSTSWLVLSNYTGYDDDFAMDLVAGINFKGDVNLTRGALSRLADLAGIETFSHMTGPVDEYRAGQNAMDFLGIRLSAPVPMAMDFGGLTVNSAEMLLRSPLRAGDTDLHMSKWGNPGIYLRLKLEVDGRPLEIVADYDPIYTERMRFVGYFTDFSINSLSTLDSSAGGAGLEASAPTEVGPPSGLSLSEFGFDVNLDGKKLESLFIGVRMGNTWDIVPGWFNLSQMGLRFTVENPFKSSERSISVTVSGVATVAGVGLQMSVTYPSLDFMVRKEPSDVLSIGALMEYFIGGGVSLPAMNVETLAFVGNARNKAVSVTGMATGLLSVPVGHTTFEIDSLAFYLDAAKDGTKKGALRGTMSLGEATADLAAVVGTETVFSGNFNNISLRQLYMDITGETSAPDEFPEVVLEQLNVTYNYTKDTFDLLGSATIAYDKLPFDSAITTTVDIKISKRGGSGQPFSYDILLTLNGTGPVTFAEGFALNAFTLSLTYNTTAGWSVAGNFNTEIAGKTIGLTATYTSAPTGQKLLLSASATDSPKILYFANLFHLSWSRIDLTLEKTVVEGKPDQKSWGLRLDSKLSVPSVSTFDTSAEFAVDSNGKRMLKFKPKSIKTFNLSIADGIGLAYKPKEVSLTRDNANSNWSLVGIADLGITGLTGKLGKAMPTSFLASITLSKTATKVELINPLTPFNFPLPKADGQDLGKFVLEVRKIGVSLKPTVGFTAQLGLGFPKELNTYFKRQVFREYEAGNPMSMALLDCTVGSGGINLQFTTSPFLSGNANKAQNGEDWINFDFGDCGEIAMKMPSFKYNMASTYFEASGGFKIVRDLSLPLTPLRNFLDGVGMGAAKAIFPEKLPIKGISLVDENENFKTEDLISMLGDIPSDVKSALRGAGNLLNRFPDGFKSYLKFEIPTQLEFKFGFSPLGRVSFALSAPVEPIRFLYPGMVQGLVPMPGLIGIELRKLNIGTLASGSLFYGDIDAVIDMYDLPSLVTSLALPTDPGFPLPTSDQLQRRIILKNVFSIIPLSQGVPVPVPVFHDEIGFEYMGLEGIGIQAHMGIPQPDFVKGGTDLLKTLVTFFKDRSYQLDPYTPPSGQQIKFRFHDEYLQAPEYLGGGKVGTSGTVIEIGTWKYVAQLMNFCKRFVLTDIVGAIPLENRSMNKSAKLGPFEVEGTYLITTTEDFDGGAYTALKLTAGQRQDFKDVLPGVQLGQSNGSGGLIMFLRGALKASTVFDLQASFGLAASGTLGFGTGFKFSGKLGGFVETQLIGAVLLNAPELGSGTTTQTTSAQAAYPVANQVVLPAITPTTTYKRGDDLALLLDGSKTCLMLPYHSSLSSKVFTVEAWVNVVATAAERTTLVGRPGNQWRLNVLKTGQLEFAGQHPTQQSQMLYATNSAVLTFGTWTHVAMSWDGSAIEIFVNAVSKLRTSISGGLINDTTGFTVGKDLDGSAIDFIKGGITELRIWRYPRMATEIKDTMLTRLTGHEPSLVAYYPLDSDNGSIAYDAAGSGHGSIDNPKYDLARFHIVDGLDFDGDGDYISIPALSGIKTGAYMLEVLLRTDRHDDAPARGVIGSSSNLELATDLPSSNFGVAVGIKPGKFVSLIQAVNVQGKGLYYVDGRYVSDWDNKGSSTASTIRVDIGKSGRVGLPTFKGRIYEVRIHNVKWGETSVLQNFNKYRAVDDSTIIAHFKLGKARNGILYSERGDVAAQVYIKPRLEQLQFDGIRFTDANQFGQLPMSDKYCGTGTYTVEAWIKPDVVDANSRFLVRGIQFAPRVAIQNGGLSARWYTASNGFKQVDSPKNLIKAGVWQHIAVSWDGQQIGLYVNGVLVKGGSHEGGLQKGATEIAVGRRELNKTTENYLGSIEEVRIWNTARTQAEIGRYMKYRLIGNEPGLVAYYPISLVDTNPLKDYGPNGLHGKLDGIVSAIVPVGANSPTTSTTNSPVQRKQVQAVGHSHLKIGGREVMVADMRLSDDEFWFKGNINLFPADSKLKVSGLAEALIKKDSLYLYSDTEVALFGMTLSKSKMLITHQQMRIEGQFLGINTLLDVVWSGNDPRFTGRVWADYSRTFDIGAIYINGVRMCDNYRISLDVGFDIGLDITKSAFKANVAAKFKVADVGFDYSFTLDSAFPDLDALGDYLRDELAANASKYLSHIFSSALNYITEAVDGALEFLGNNLVQLGNILGGAFQTAWTEVADFWIQAGGEFVDLYQVLRGPLAVGLNDLASKFKQLGAGFGEIAEVFQGWGNTLSDTAGALINGAGATIDQAVSVMEDLGKNVTEAGVAIKNAVGEQWNAITQALNKYYDPNLVARVLKEDLGRTVNQVASIYKAISLDLDKAYDAVAFAFGGGNLASKAFRSAGYICDDVGKMLRRYFDVSQVSSILKGSGYSTKEVTSMLKSVYNYSKSQAESILKGIESDVNVIGDALKQVFG